jgi:hypothetical protein
MSIKHIKRKTSDMAPFFGGCGGKEKRSSVETADL